MNKRSWSNKENSGQQPKRRKELETSDRDRFRNQDPENNKEEIRHTSSD